MARQMAKDVSARRDFGSRKYAALHLMLARWLRSGADNNQKYVYVTLGGTELRDIHSIYFIDPGLATEIFSFESNRERFQIANESAKTLSNLGISVNLSNQNVFAYQRKSALPHIFFLDLEGICAWADYDKKIGEMFQDETIKEGDCILITSHLGHHRGLDVIQDTFAGEFAVLGINDAAEARNSYRRSHPSFTLYKALINFGLTRELALRCIGCVKYRDTTPMAIYGYMVTEGKTELKSLIHDTETRYFDMKEIRICNKEKF